MSDQPGNPDSPGKPSQTKPRKLPVFDYERCKACGICAHFCPKDALEVGPDGYPRLTAPDACNACRQCERLCPDFAVDLSEGGEQGVPSEVAPEVCNAFLACEE
jgi:2-oxoglutarate ferredoxin oxidoreductase subunit delta